MTINTHEHISRSFRWDVWWRWSIVSFIGAVLGALLLRELDPILLPLGTDEDFQLWEPWRLAVLNGVLYAPLSLVQWWILRRYISSAVEWVMITIGSVVVVYPGMIWLFLTIGLEDPAWFVWFLGLGGSGVYGLAQCLTPLRWLSVTKRWLLWPAAAVVVGTLVLQISQQFANVWQMHLSATDPRAMIATWGIYYTLMGLVLAYMLQNPVAPHDTSIHK
jgi:hypothetical protein